MVQSNDIISDLAIIIASASIVISIFAYSFTRKQYRINYLLKQLEDFYSPLYEYLRRFFRSKRNDKQLQQLYKKLSDLQLKYGHLCDLEFFNEYNSLMFELSIHPEIIENWKKIRYKVDVDKRVEIHRKKTIDLASSVIDDIRDIIRIKMNEIFRSSATIKQKSENKKQLKQLEEEIKGFSDNDIL